MRDGSKRNVDNSQELSDLAQNERNVWNTILGFPSETAKLDRQSLQPRT